MARKTIAQLRAAEVTKLANLQKVKPTTPAEEEKALATAQRIMNRFYRLSMLSYRAFMASNDSSAPAVDVVRLEADEARQVKRLANDLQNIYGFTLDYSGIFPSIVYYDEDYKKHHKVRTAPISYFYYPYE